MAEAPAFANDGSFFDKFKELAGDPQPGNSEQAAASTSEPPAAAPEASTSVQAADEDFMPSTSFTGAREGFAFTTGDRGLGYYRDVPLHLRRNLQAKAKPVALKSNSIIKGLQRRTSAAQPDPKKRKTDNDSSKPSYLKEMERYRAMSCNSDTKHDRPLVK